MKNEELSKNYNTDWTESDEYQRKAERHKIDLIRIGKANENLRNIFYQEMDKFE